MSTSKKRTTKQSQTKTGRKTKEAVVLDAITQAVAKRNPATAKAVTEMQRAGRLIII